jgi:hypothetical protein
MSEFLENLKRGMQEAQLKFQAAQQRQVAANAEFQAAAQEFNAWQTLVAATTRKEMRTAAPAALPAATPAAVTVSAQATVSPNVAAQLAASGKPEGNKTNTVRELLRQHPAGMTPLEIWKQVESQMTNRAYLYSVLKRLKDRGDARERRGKYFLNPKVEEAQNPLSVQ